MVQRTPPAWKTDDRRFRVRIKFQIPQGGFRGLSYIHAWLRDRFGLKGYAVHPIDWDVGIECFAVHIDDISQATEVAQHIEDVVAERVAFPLVPDRPGTLIVPNGPPPFTPTRADHPLTQEQLEMCGRFTNIMTWEELHAIYQAFLEGMASSPWTPKVNIAPTTQVPVVRFIHGTRRIDLMRWGLVPSWSKEIGRFATFNARSDGCEDKPTYRGAWKAARRCVIPATSFFEWRKSDKQPFAIALGNRGPMSFAGLWDEAHVGGTPLLSCTIITTDANEFMKSIHDRMPVILDDDKLAAWLGEEPETPDEIRAMLGPLSPDRLTMWPVSKSVGNVKNQGKELTDNIVLTNDKN